MDFFGFLFSAPVSQENEIPQNEDVPCLGSGSANTAGLLVCVIA
jgi:hypothetical protein